MNMAHRHAGHQQGHATPEITLLATPNLMSSVTSPHRIVHVDAMCTIEIALMDWTLLANKTMPPDPFSNVMMMPTTFAHDEFVPRYWQLGTDPCSDVLRMGLHLLGGLHRIFVTLCRHTMTRSCWDEAAG
ncbi:hypothetical protein [Burkholderia sp. AW49-1]